jgi:hypothetical protein
VAITVALVLATDVATGRTATAASTRDRVPHPANPVATTVAAAASAAATAKGRAHLLIDVTDH